MWIKVNQAAEFAEDRWAIATIERRVFINANLPMINPRRFVDLPEFNEKLVRMLLSNKYGDVSKWQLHVVSYRLESDSIVVHVTSPDFDEVPEGIMAPEIQPPAR